MVAVARDITTGTGIIFRLLADDLWHLPQISPCPCSSPTTAPAASVTDCWYRKLLDPSALTQLLYYGCETKLVHIVLYEVLNDEAEAHRGQTLATYKI